MDYEQLIENYECLKTYFTEFPKKLHQLALEVMEYISFIANFNVFLFRLGKNHQFFSEQWNLD